jgi:hypothetical protein
VGSVEKSGGQIQHDIKPCDALGLDVEFVINSHRHIILAIE